MLSRKGQEMPHLLSFCQLNSRYVKLSINFNVSRVPEFQRVSDRCFYYFRVAILVSSDGLQHGVYKYTVL